MVKVKPNKMSGIRKPTHIEHLAIKSYFDFDLSIVECVSFATSAAILAFIIFVIVEIIFEQSIVDSLIISFIAFIACCIYCCYCKCRSNKVKKNRYVVVDSIAEFVCEVSSGEDSTSYLYRVTNRFGEYCNITLDDRCPQKENRDGLLIIIKGLRNVYVTYEELQKHIL